MFKKLLFFYFYIIITLGCSDEKNLKFIGRPIEITPLILDFTLAANKDGHQRFYTCTYSRGNRFQGCSLIEVNPFTGEITYKKQIHDRIGLYQVVSGSDGIIYLGIYGNGSSELWSYNPHDQIIKNLGNTIKGEDFTFGMTSTPWDKIYGGTHGNLIRKIKHSRIWEY